MNSKEKFTVGEKILAGVFALVFLFAFYVTLDANKYTAQVRVIEGEGSVGVNPTTESLDFGDLSRGATVVRRISLSNESFLPVFVIVWKMGSISELLDVGDNFFKLEKEESTRIEFKNFVPASAEIDQVYKGRVYLFKIPTFGL